MNVGDLKRKIKDLDDTLEIFIYDEGFHMDDSMYDKDHSKIILGINGACLFISDDRATHICEWCGATVNSTFIDRSFHCIHEECAKDGWLMLPFGEYK
ncbi:MAG: hypothetical protein AABY07_01095 [Nanoarchaeota archaeon]